MDHRPRKDRSKSQQHLREKKTLSKTPTLVDLSNETSPPVVDLSQSDTQEIRDLYQSLIR